MKRYVIIKKSVPTEETLAMHPETKTKYHIYGKNQYLLNDIWNNESYDFNDSRLKTFIRAFAWEAPKGCKISLRAHQKYAEYEISLGHFISTCEMAEVEV